MIKLFHKPEGNNPYRFIPASLEKRLISRSMKIRERHVLPKYRSRLTNHSFSIVVDCCYGGTLSHELLEQQRSPFVNCAIPYDDYYNILINLEDRMSEQLKDTDIEFYCPVAQLGGDRINMVHYKSFEEAFDIWERRKTRINYSNLFIIVSDGTTNDGRHMSIEMCLKFLNLPFDNLIVITNDVNKSKLNERVIYMKKYKNEKMFYPGAIELFGGKRCLERYIDIIHWLNTGEIRKPQ